MFKYLYKAASPRFEHACAEAMLLPVRGAMCPVGDATARPSIPASVPLALGICTHG